MDQNASNPKGKRFKYQMQDAEQASTNEQSNVDEAAEASFPEEEDKPSKGKHAASFDPQQEMPKRVQEVEVAAQVQEVAGETQAAAQEAAGETQAAAQEAAGETQTAAQETQVSARPLNELIERITKRYKLIGCIAVCVIALILCVVVSSQHDVSGNHINSNDATSSSSVSASEIDVELPGLYVLAASGNDEQAGSIASPLATLSEALERVRLMRSSGEIGENEEYTIWLRGGEYVIDQALELGSEDSNLRICGWQDEEVTITLQHEITGFYEEELNGVRVFVKDLAAHENVTALFDDEGALEVSRYPKTGYLEVASVEGADALWTASNAPSSISLGQLSFTANTSDLEGVSWCDGMQVHLVHSWHDELSDVTELDVSTGRVGMADPASLTIAAGDRYCLENVLSTLSEPGEWCIDRASNKLYYVPRADESTQSLVLYAATGGTLLGLNGANNVSFERVCFARTGWSDLALSTEYSTPWLTANGMEMPQAAVEATGAITLCNVSAVRFSNCEFTDLGATAVRMEYGVVDAVVENCLFKNLGASAIFVGGKNVDASDATATSLVTIRNNSISDYGCRHYGAPGIAMLYCDGAIIQNNEVSNGRYTGISVGWRWGYGSHITNDILISNNLIYRIGDGSLHDMGGIYTLGIQPGTTIAHNVIHNVAINESGSYGGWGIYLDEGSSGMTVDSNLAYACSSEGFYMHYGASNVISNNIFALNGIAQLSFGSRPDKMMETSTYKNNIILTEGDILAYCNLSVGDKFIDEGDIVWNLDGEDKLSISLDNGETRMTYSEARESGFLLGTTVKNPMFNNPREFDFTITGIRALMSGVTTWDYNEAGTLLGTTIGLNTPGGTTAYNDDAVSVTASE